MNRIDDPGALRLYRKMALIRAVEERLAKVQGSGELPGPVHLYIGQEAIAAGVCSVLTDDDWIASTHRGHGHFLAKSPDTRLMVAEVFGRVTGVCKGKGGSMHVADISRGILGANGIVGGGIALAAGAALAEQIAATRNVGVVFFGDGAANQGVLFETMNIAALWKLPLIFVCENNGFSEFSPTSTVTAGDIWRRAEPFGLPTQFVDGNDAEAVVAATVQAVERARAGQGASFIEARTYRFRGHVEGEMTFLSKKYREEEEIKERQLQDPLMRMRNQLAERGVAEPALADVEESVQREVDEAFEFAAQSAWPEAAIAFDHMFA